MHTKVVYQGAKGAGANRMRGAAIQLPRRRPQRRRLRSGRAGEKEDFSAALDYMAERHPGARLWAAGFSFGAWVALETGAQDDRVSALIGIAPPVATSVSGQNYTFEHTLASRKPKFFVQGEADEVCPLEAMWAFYAKLLEPGSSSSSMPPITCSRERRKK